MTKLTVADVCDMYRKTNELFKANGQVKRFKILKIMNHGTKEEYLYYNTTDPIKIDGTMTFYGQGPNSKDILYVEILGGIISHSEQIICKGE